MLRKCSTLITQLPQGTPWLQLAAAFRHSCNSWSQGGVTSAAGLQYSQSGSYSAAAMPSNAMDLIKELRRTSGAPIADVKTCLAASNWDMSAAMEALRLKGLAAAVKKASRHASEGLVAVAQRGHDTVSVIEINSETDFVGRSELFQKLLSSSAAAALNMAAQAAAAAAAAPGQVHELDVKQLAAARLEDGSSIEEACANLAGKVRENVALRRGYVISAGPNGVVSSYVHMPVAPSAGRIAAVVALQAAGSQIDQAALAELTQLGANLAMHSAGMNTQYISPETMPPEALAAVRADLATATAAQMSGKAAHVLDKIVEGKVAKWCKEFCLLDQKYILDDTVTVAQLLKQHAKQLQLAGLHVSALLRVQVGEGMQQQQESKADFAAEVAAMAGVK